METLNKIRKAQALPLNTIVIAILVIIVLLVIIVFFTTKFGEQSGVVGETGDDLKLCDETNPALGSLYNRIDIENADQCEDGGTKIPGMNVEEGQICCGYN